MPDYQMNAGQLDRLVVLQRKVVPSPKNALGEPVETWRDLAVVPAQKVDDAGTEETRGGETAAKISATFLIRYTQFSPPLNPRDRLLFNPDPTQPAADGLVFNIHGLIEVGRRRGHAISASARADQL